MASLEQVFESFIAALRGSSGMTVEDHEHRCGLDVAHPDRVGCGHVWSHGGDEIAHCTEEEHIDFHTCPRCGRGPWYTKSNEFTEAEAAARRRAATVCRFLT